MVHVQLVGIPEFKSEEAYCSATQTGGASSAIILIRSTVEYSIVVRSDHKRLELGC